MNHFLDSHLEPLLSHIDATGRDGCVSVFKMLFEQTENRFGSIGLTAIVSEALGPKGPMIPGYEGVVFAISGIVEARDAYTGAHQRKVAELAVNIGKRVGLTDDELTCLRLAAIIHDLGKIRVPAEILSKPSLLSRGEMILLQEHPVLGKELLSPIKFPWPLADIVVQHHERYDGSGYPNNLAGKNIMIEARILAIADVLDAMSSHRPYRVSPGFNAAVSEITQGRGTHFDPEITDAVLCDLAEDIDIPVCRPVMADLARRVAQHA